MTYKKKLDDRDSFRLNVDDKEYIRKAAEKAGVDKGEIYRIGSLKEAKRILREIEKDRWWMKQVNTTKMKF